MDIYSDLPEIDLGDEITKLQETNKQLEEHIAGLEKQIEVLSEQVAKMRQTQVVLETNISELFKTAKAEIERKDRTVTELRRELDDLILRRIDKDAFFNKKRTRERESTEPRSNCNAERRSRSNRGTERSPKRINRSNEHERKRNSSRKRDSKREDSHGKRETSTSDCNDRKKDESKRVDNDDRSRSRSHGRDYKSGVPRNRRDSPLKESKRNRSRNRNREKPTDVVKDTVKIETRMDRVVKDEDFTADIVIEQFEVRTEPNLLHAPLESNKTVQQQNNEVIILQVKPDAAEPIVPIQNENCSQEKRKNVDVQDSTKIETRMDGVIKQDEDFTADIVIEQFGFRTEPNRQYAAIESNRMVQQQNTDIIASQAKPIVSVVNSLSKHQTIDPNSADLNLSNFTSVAQCINAPSNSSDTNIYSINTVVSCAANRNPKRRRCVMSFKN